MKKRKVGAPKGGRVHWVLHELPTEFKGKYILAYQYKYHRYIFYRLDGRKLYDIFIVNRSKKARYFRAVYANLKRNEIELFGHKKPSMIAEKMYDLYLQDKKLSGRE